MLGRSPHPAPPPRPRVPLRWETARLSGDGKRRGSPSVPQCFRRKGRPAQGSTNRRGRVPAANKQAAVVKPCVKFDFEN